MTLERATHVELRLPCADGSRKHGTSNPSTHFKALRHALDDPCPFGMFDVNQVI